MLVAGWWLWPDGILGAALRIFGIIPLVTGLIGWSPFYSLFDWSTRRTDRRPTRAEPEVADRQQRLPDSDRHRQSGHPESG